MSEQKTLREQAKTKLNELERCAGLTIQDSLGVDLSDALIDILFEVAEAHEKDLQERLEAIRKNLLGKEFLEKLAELEHKQWMTWATTMLKTENISQERKDQWFVAFAPYADLPEELKGSDREWTNKIIKELKEILDGSSLKEKAEKIGDKE